MKRGVPFTPDDIPALKAVSIPSFVFDCFNDCIAETYANGKATVLQHIVQTKIEEICQHDNIPFNIHFLDIEDSYGENGWKVSYDKPAYCESYDACFYFSKK